MYLGWRKRSSGGFCGRCVSQFMTISAYEVFVYLHSYTHMFLYIYLGRRKRSSGDFYGRCVSQFVTITTPVKYTVNPDIMVFVTYPMMHHAGVYICIF